MKQHKRLRHVVGLIIVKRMKRLAGSSEFYYLKGVLENAGSQPIPEFTKRNIENEGILNLYILCKLCVTLFHFNLNLFIFYIYKLIISDANCATCSCSPWRSTSAISLFKVPSKKMITSMRKWYTYMINCRKSWTVSLIKEILTTVYNDELTVRKKISFT